MNLDDMRHEDAPRAFQAPVDVHASADGQVYMFRGRSEELETSSEDEELNVIELRPRSRDFTSQGRNRAGEMLLLERHISHEDNLNKLALQYGCKVADIKRVNNLIKEQDLYALKFIKIPVKKHGLLTENNSELQHPQQRSSSSALGASDQLQNSATADSSFSSQVQQYVDFFKEVDNDIEQLIQSTETQEEAFTHGSDGRKPWGFRGQRLISYGADWGIRWWNAVIAMLCIGIVLPVFYVVYFTIQNSKADVTNSTSTLNNLGVSISTVSPKSIIRSHLENQQI